MTTCPYLTCRGLFGHPGPHLFEQLDIERLKRETAQQERERLRARLLEWEGGPLDDAAIVAILAEPNE